MNADYKKDVQDDAVEMISNFQDEIAEMLLNDGKASDDANNDYPDGDSYHHENHVDKSYDLQESAEILAQLSDFEETDSGLWEGLGPREAISAQAAYTYGNAVSSCWRDIIENINDSDSCEALQTLADEFSDDKEVLKMIRSIAVSLVLKVAKDN